MENGHYEPDLVSMLQMRVGDIETNPGPVMTRRQSRSEEANHVNHGDPIVGELEESPSKDASHVQSQETKKIRTPMRVRKEGKLPRRRINTNRKKLTPHQQVVVVTQYAANPLTVEASLSHVRVVTDSFTSCVEATDGEWTRW